VPKRSRHRDRHRRITDNKLCQLAHSGGTCQEIDATSDRSPKHRFGIRRAFLMLSKQRNGGRMAKIIEFYIPQSFRKVSKWFPANQTAKMLFFSLAGRMTATLNETPQAEPYCAG
jgi:hypothetical protein